MHLKQFGGLPQVINVSKELKIWEGGGINPQPATCGKTPNILQLWLGNTTQNNSNTFN